MGSSNSNPKPTTEPYLATHHIILAQAAAAKLYKEVYQVVPKLKVTRRMVLFSLCYKLLLKATQGGEIGISLICQWFEPHPQHHHDKDAAERAVDFLLGW